jgi:tRNA-dihydrouridine synthase
LQAEHPYHLVPQIIVRDVEEFNLLTKAVTDLGFKEIDINMGCPYPMQTKSGRGSGLLPQPEKVREILDAITRLSQADATSDLKFSIKMRLGLTSPEECLQLLPLLNEAPLAHITLHPRVGIQQYKGALDFENFDKFYSECKLPLIFNGDIADLKQMNFIETRYPRLAGIMIGRGLLANPILAAQYAGLPCGTTTETLLKIHADVAADYARRLQGNAQILDKIRPFWTYADLPKKTRKKIEKSKTLDEYLEAVNELT